MKYVKIILQFIVFTGYSLVQPSQGAIPTPALKPLAKSAPKQINTAKTAPASAQPKNTPPTNPVVLEKIPYLQELQQANMSPEILKGWQQLYDQFLQANSDQPHAVAGTAHATAQPKGAAHFIQNPSALKTLLTTNFFNLMAQYLNPTTFPKFNNDPDSQIHFNYATTHLRDTALRLGSISSITDVSGTPTTNFTGDCRDLGIIVNIQNNTDAQFSINQTSLDGTKTIQIGQINPGLNEVNLHTAALQNSSSSTNQTINYFEIVELNAENPIKISLRIMTGNELVNFLKTLPRNKLALEKDIFEMNGRPTGSDYLAMPDDFYMTIIQNPTPKSELERDINQRIQAINISKFTGPYLLTMQINAENLKIKSQKKSEQAIDLFIFQPSITSAQMLTNQTIKSLNFAFLILPKFLSKIENLTTLWMLATTSTFAAHTNYALFGQNSFANTFEYFKNLSCFNNQNRYVFFIDLYNISKVGDPLYNASWLMANNIYETDLSHCSDIPQIYTAQDPYGHVIVNEHNFYYVNFIAMFTPQVTELDNQKLFNAQGFNATYTYPLNQLYSFINNALTSEMKEGIFGATTQIKPGVFKLTWTNKKNKIISSQTLYLHAQPSNIQITFDNIHTNWVGSAVPTNLLPLEIGKTQNFKVTYEFSPTNNKHILLAQATSAIDRQAVFLPLQFSEFPIQELYVDVFNIFNVKPFTRCYVIKNGILPLPLLNLTQEDWQSGIYMVPVIHNNEKLSPSNPGALTLAFYGPAKNFLGEITISGQFNNTNETGIKEPVHAYNAGFNHFNSLMDLYLSTGVLLKYVQTE